MKESYKGLYITLIVLLVILLLVIGVLACYFFEANRVVLIKEIHVEINFVYILYHGDRITVQPGLKRYGYSLNIEDTTIQETYDGKTYYNYENNEYLGESLGKLEGMTQNDTGTVYGLVTNVRRIATFTELNAFPREISKNQDIIGEKLKGYDDVYKVDLDGDGKLEYLCFKYGDAEEIKEGEISGEYTRKYVTTVDLLDESYKLISNLIVFTDYKKENGGEEVIYLTNVDIIDIDGDGVFEIFIDLYGKEDNGRVAIYRYKDNQIYGLTNYKTSIIPYL